MSYKLDFDADFAAAARLAARERLDKGATVLSEEQDDDPVEAVHEARKEIKKARSLLRLARPGLQKRTYRRENGSLRDAARTVAHVRDADVMVETVDALRERFDGRVSARTFAAVRRRLAKDAERSRADGNASVGAELTQTLEAVAERVDDWPLDGGWAVARKGVARTYKRGRKAFAVADADPTAENLHELRKRVKDLWYQERLLQPAWPAMLGAHADEAHTLADMLGDDHDLAVLAERLPRTLAASDVLLELIDERRRELLAEIRLLGRRLYAEKPKAFARRLRDYIRHPAAAG